MPEWLSQMSSPDFMPHGYCYLWDPGILWLHVISDSLITVSYFCIPIALVYLVRQRKDMPFDWIFWMCGLFIMGCGATHFMEVWTVWHASYLLSGIIKAFTAAVSVITAMLLIPLVPKAVALPSPAQLHLANLELERQIAERKRAEEALQKSLVATVERTAQLEAANQELESFTYSVSHDLRAPLRHMAGFSGILLEEYAPTLDSQARHYLSRIQEGSGKMGQLVDELLSLTRLGRHVLRLQVTQLDSIVAEVVSMLQPEIEGREVEWKIGSLPFVECDPILMKQVFQNLISNALKYSRPRSRTLIEIGQANSDGQHALFVRDNGVGFSMKYADKLFGVFQRLHRAEDFEGTGVGLAIVQRIIQKHGGRVWVEAELNQGATFYFTVGAPQSIAVKTRTVTAGGQS